VCADRGAEEERQSARRRSNAALIGVCVAAMALVALALHSSGQAQSGQAPGLSLAAKRAAVSKLWSHEGANGASSGDTVAVTEDDVSNLGLRAPAGFNVPSVNVTAEDIARLGLVAPPGFIVENTVSEDDIARLGLSAPNGEEIPEMVVTEDDMERYGLATPTADGGSAGGPVVVTPEDVERYGLVAPQGISARLNMSITQDDIDRLGLASPTMTEDEAKVRCPWVGGVFGWVGWMRRGESGGGGGRERRGK
jgi:hypothetical protein